MPFQQQRFVRHTNAYNAGQISTTFNPDTPTVLENGPAIFSYASAAETVAQIGAANYFALVVYDLAVNDMIYCVGSDASIFYQVATVNRDAGTVTVVSAFPTGSVGTANIQNLAVTTGKLALDAVTNAQLADGAVSLENLDSGIAPSHVVKYAGASAQGGGSATVTITVTGMLITDLPFCQIGASTNAVNVQKVTATANTITVLCSGAPGAASVFNYQVLRAAV
jgi:hypothetical protein